MSTEQKYTAIILKKTQFNDADEIITFYTEDLGKVRGLAKSIKLQKSKLQHSLQGLFLVKVTFAESRNKLPGMGLKKIIHCEVINSHANIRKFLPIAKAGMFSAEAVFRSTPDEQKNSEVFNLLKNFLEFLNAKEYSEDFLLVALVKFKLLLLKYLGHEIIMPSKTGEKFFFSNTFGGFGYNLVFQDRIEASAEILDWINNLLKTKLEELPKKNIGVKSFSNVLDSFLEYQIERTIHSKNFLT